MTQIIIAGRVEDELKRIFETEQIVGGGLNILDYKKTEGTIIK